MKTKQKARFNGRATTNNSQMPNAVDKLMQNQHHTILSQRDWDDLTPMGENPASLPDALTELAVQHRARKTASDER